MKPVKCPKLIIIENKLTAIFKNVQFAKQQYEYIFTYFC